MRRGDQQLPITNSEYINKFQFFFLSNEQKIENEQKQAGTRYNIVYVMNITS